MLNIILGHGLSNRFLQYFACIDLETGTCGLSYKEKKRVIVEDITECPIFCDKPSLQYLLEENILCAQSTPLISSSGKFVGVINTSYPDQKQFSEREIRMLDMLARLAADVIEQTRVELALQESERRAIALVEDLKKADRNKNHFLNSLSHELRNPLASMMMSLSLLKIAAPDSEQALQAGETFERQTIQLSRLVDDLLEVTRISQNKIKLKKDLVELNNLVSKTVKDYKQMFANKGVSLEVKSPLKPIHLQADSTRLTQVIGNLLHNALKFTDSGGQTQVIISKEDKSKQAVIQVKDNGLGIKLELLEDLFQPFTQADTSLEHSSGGLGLGLAIVKGMVELHGGNVMAFSEGLGKGSEFTIRLPLNIDDKPNQVKELQKGQKISCKRRILVIDDIPDVLEIMCSLLRHLGHEVTTASNGIKGISEAKEFKPDVILCDIGLPGMNGYEVAQNIRRDHKMKDIILIALSGYAQSEDLERSKEAGFNCHLAKPVDLDKLEQILAEDIIIDATQNIGA
jgi:signal transduction histidine kinase/ActR/RegA family two-component response regulator